METKEYEKKNEIKIRKYAWKYICSCNVMTRISMFDVELVLIIVFVAIIIAVIEPRTYRLLDARKAWMKLFGLGYYQ